MTLTIEQFCEKHDACREGREWALNNCKDMEEVWQTAKPSWLIWIATRQGVLTDKELRLFAVWCARQVQHLMTDERSIDALEVAERYANGFATDDELAAAWAAANAARAAAYAADATDAAWADPAWAAANAAWADAAWSAAYAADAAWSAAYAADAAWDAADAAKEQQAAWLRANCKPNFE